jgi:hypothetical protein
MTHYQSALSTLTGEVLAGSADIIVSLDSQAAAIVERMASLWTPAPTLLVRPALNPWGMDQDAHERAYDQVAATCVEILRELRGASLTLSLEDRLARDAVSRKQR